MNKPQEVQIIICRIVLKIVPNFAQVEFRSMISQLSFKLQHENERRLEQLLGVVEDRLSAKKFEPEEEKHLR